MPEYRPRFAVGAVCLALLLSATACGDGDPDGPPAMETVDTEKPTANSSPSPHGEETVTLRRTHQGYVTGLKIGVKKTSDGEATLSVNAGPGIDEDSPEKVTGEVGDSVDLDNGYTIDFEKVEDSDPDKSDNAPTGSVTLTVTPPKE